jgi:hypothetical protein
MPNQLANRSSALAEVKGREILQQSIAEELQPWPAALKSTPAATGVSTWLDPQDTPCDRAHDLMAHPHCCL